MLGSLDHLFLLLVEILMDPFFELPRVGFVRKVNRAAVANVVEPFIFVAGVAGVVLAASARHGVWPGALVARAAAFLV